MLLVTKGKSRINQLGYDKKTCEYVYIHKGVEVWREKGDNSLLNYFNEVRAGIRTPDYFELVNTFEIYKKYSNSCDKTGY